MAEECGESAERILALRMNDKGIYNSYLRQHLFGKGISYELIKKCLTEGKEVTASLRRRKEGTRYFVLPVEREADLPGMFVLPSSGGYYGNKVSNWNAKCEYKFRHGRLVPVIARKNIPEWLIQYATTFWVIVEKNELPDGTLMNHDGPTEEDPEGSWMVITAHFGPPSFPKPKVPKDCSDKEKLREYLMSLDNWTRQQWATVYIDLEADGQTGPSEEKREERDEITELKKIVSFLQTQIEELRTETKRLRKIATKRTRPRKKDA